MNRIMCIFLPTIITQAAMSSYLVAVIVLVLRCLNLEDLSAHIRITEPRF